MTFSCSWPVLPLAPSRTPQDACEGLAQPILPADPPSPADERAECTITTTCAACGQDFEHPRRGGPKRRFCGRACRNAFYEDRRKARRADPDAEPLQERQCSYCTEPFTPTDESQTTCSNMCRSLKRSDRFAQTYDEQHAAH